MRVGRQTETAGLRPATIDLLRIMLIVLMISIHIPWKVDPAIGAGIKQFISGGGWTVLPFDPVQHGMLWLRLGLAGGSVSMLTIISAWLMVSSLERRGALQILHGKTQSLLKPYLGWCIAFGLAFVAVRGDWPGLGAIFGIGRWPLNFPLHFLLDLFLVSAIFLFAYPLLRGRSWTMAAFGFLLGGYTLYAGSGVADFGANGMSLLPRAAIVFLFFVGAASHQLLDRLFRAPERLTSAPVLAGLGLLVAGFSYVKLMNNMVVPEVSPIVAGLLFLLDCAGRLVAGLFMLGVAMRLTMWRPIRVNRKMPFRIFCSHAIMLFLLTELRLFAKIGSDDLLVFFAIYALAVGFGVLVHLGMEWIGRRRVATLAARQPMAKG